MPRLRMLRQDVYAGRERPHQDSTDEWASVFFLAITTSPRYLYFHDFFESRDRESSKKRAKNAALPAGLREWGARTLAPCSV